MQKVKSLFAMALGLVLLVSVGTAHAIKDKVSLESATGKAEAKGEALIKDAANNQKQITVNVSGLQPNSTYTVWFTGEEAKDMAAVGQKGQSFTTDANGNAQYTANVARAGIDKWKKLEVALHPDGNPSNMDNIRIELKGDLG